MATLEERSVQPVNLSLENINFEEWEGAVIEDQGSGSKIPSPPMFVEATINQIQSLSVMGFDMQNQNLD